MLPLKLNKSLLLSSIINAIVYISRRWRISYRCLARRGSLSFLSSMSFSFLSSLSLVSNCCLGVLLFLTVHHAGYAVGSLALVADSFHMLKCVSILFHGEPHLTLPNSDVMSLIVALYAIKVSFVLALAITLLLHHVPVDCSKCSGLTLLVWLASRRDPSRFGQWRIPPRFVFLNISGGYRAVLQHSWFAYVFDML